MSIQNKPRPRGVFVCLPVYLPVGRQARLWRATGFSNHSHFFGNIIERKFTLHLKLFVNTCAVVLHRVR